MKYWFMSYANRSHSGELSIGSTIINKHPIATIRTWNASHGRIYSLISYQEISEEEAKEFYDFDFMV